MLYLNLSSVLTVERKKGGKVILDRISSAEISSTIEVLGDTAVVVIPRRFGDKVDGSLREYLAEGDKVILELGYNGEMNVEFEGYIRDLESGFPMKLHLDDETYPLRKNSFVKSWKSVTLKEVLQFIAPDYEIDCHDANLGKFEINSQSTLTILRDIKAKYGFYTFIKGKKLTCKFKYEIADTKNVHVYDFSKNVKKNRLKYKRKEDRKIRICAVSYSRDGKRIKEEVGDKEQFASVKTLSFTGKTSKELKELAAAEYNRVCYDGFTGTVTGFGIPLTKKGDTLKLISKREPERNGQYLIEGVKVRYGNAYYERINELSYKIQ